MELSLKINISKKDVVWNYVGTIFSMGMGYLLLPFLLIYFDDETLGIWYIFMSLANIANLFVLVFLRLLLEILHIVGMVQKN